MTHAEGNFIFVESNPQSSHNVDMNEPQSKTVVTLKWFGKPQLILCQFDTLVRPKIKLYRNFLLRNYFLGYFFRLKKTASIRFVLK